MNSFKIDECFLLLTTKLRFTFTICFEMIIRIFIALELPEIVKREILEIQRRLVIKDAKIKWVSKENTHLTLKFLGGVEESLMPDIYEAMDGSSKSFNSFQLKLTDAGLFPNRGRPKIIWAGVGGHTSKLESLADNCDSAMHRIGFKRENRKFKPHVTIGRIRRLSVPEDLSRRMKELEVDPIEFEAAKINIIKSDLTSGGAVHTILNSINLVN